MLFGVLLKENITLQPFNVHSLRQLLYYSTLQYERDQNSGFWCNQTTMSVIIHGLHPPTQCPRRMTGPPS